MLLAAGPGSRIAALRAGRPKPVVPLLGLSLAERVLLAAMEGGVRRFVVVLGCAAEKVRAEFERIAAERSCSVAFVESPDWALGNGASALAGARAVGEERFLLLMTDHLADPELVRRVRTTPIGSSEIALGIDCDRGRLFDPEEATKVRLDGERVRGVGKGMEPWHGADTGVFHCSPALAEGLERTAARGRHGLSDAVAVLAEEGAVRAIDVSGLSWIDVDTPAALREARRRLLSTLSVKQDDGFISRRINRRVSLRISAWLASTAITPTQITLASFGLALLGAVLLALGHPVVTALGGLVVQLASILDGSDGEVARFKRRETRRGAWLDTMLDRYADIAVVLAITYAQARMQPVAEVWLGGLLALSGFVLASYTTKEYALRHGRPYPQDLLDRLRRRDLRLLVIALGAVIGHPYAAMLSVGVLGHVCAIGILVRGWRGATVG